MLIQSMQKVVDYAVPMRSRGRKRERQEDVDTTFVRLDCKCVCGHRLGAVYQDDDLRIPLARTFFGDKQRRSLYREQGETFLRAECNRCSQAKGGRAARFVEWSEIDLRLRLLQLTARQQGKVVLEAVPGR